MNQSHRLKNKTRYNKSQKYVKSLSFPKFTRKSVKPTTSQFVLVSPPKNTYIRNDARRIDPIKNAGKSEIIVLLVLHGQDLPTNLDESLKENTLMFSMANPGCMSSMRSHYDVMSSQGGQQIAVSPYFIKKYLTQQLRTEKRSVADVMQELSQRYKDKVLVKSRKIPPVTFNYSSDHAKEVFRSYKKRDITKEDLDNELESLNAHKYATPMVYTKDREYMISYENELHESMCKSENIDEYFMCDYNLKKSLSIPLGIHVIDVRYPKTQAQADLFKNAADDLNFKVSNMLFNRPNITKMKLSVMLKLFKKVLHFDNISVFDYGCRTNGVPETYEPDAEAGKRMSAIFKSKGLG